jgi:hypothetical protein
MIGFKSIYTSLIAILIVFMMDDDDKFRVRAAPAAPPGAPAPYPTGASTAPGAGTTTNTSGGTFNTKAPGRIRVGGIHANLQDNHLKHRRGCNCRSCR